MCLALYLEGPGPFYVCYRTAAEAAFLASHHQLQNALQICRVLAFYPPFLL